MTRLRVFFLRVTCLSAASMLDFFFVGFGMMFLLLLLSLALQIFLTNGPKDVGSDFISRDYKWNILFFGFACVHCCVP